MNRSRGTRDVAMLIAGAALAVGGLVFGGAFGGSSALALPQQGADAARFGFSVPFNGFAVVKGLDGGAYVVDGTGMATRVLVRTNASAPDQPRTGSTAQLDLH